MLSTYWEAFNKNKRPIESDVPVNILLVNCYDFQYQIIIEKKLENLSQYYSKTHDSPVLKRNNSGL